MRIAEPGAVTVRRRLRLEIGGAVQGVGFRPFVYRVAGELGVTGWIVNDPAGVVVEAEADEAMLLRFAERLQGEAPPQALIHKLRRQWLEPCGHAGFEIRASDQAGERRATILPDLASCGDCLADICRPGDRRQGYAFTNCTNCGPRFSIIRALPYDRPNTTMAGFRLCDVCAAEYDEPADRRFHAQPNACPRCGPKLELLDAAGRRLVPRAGAAGSTGESGATGAAAGGARSLVGAVRPVGEAGGAGEIGGEAESHAAREADREAIRLAAQALRGGQILALKGIGGFHLLVDASDEAAVRRLRERKGRPTKPLAVMVAEPADAAKLCFVPAPAARALASSASPIVLLRRRPGSGIADAVAPGNPYLGVMQAYSPLHRLLLQEAGIPLVATSGNLSEEPICIDEAEALERLGGIADLFLVHDRPIERHVDDSVAWVLRGETRLLRRARGVAPLPVGLASPVPPILAVGALLKNAIALARDDQVFISQHIGDLESLQGVAAFERVISDFLRLYRVTPTAIAHDLHPDYASTHWAQREAARQAAKGTVLRLVPVQHHHAHLASCLAEHGEDGPALGVIWDGAGYGSDGTVWGGEFLLGDAAGFRRVAHLRKFRLAGGDMAVREPRRAALALVHELDEAAEVLDAAGKLGFGEAEQRTLWEMIRRGVRSPWTSSAGRLFDGVAALLGLFPRVSFEGEAAMALEFLAGERRAGDRGAAGYTFALDRAGGAEAGGSPMVLDWRPALAELLRDVAAGQDAGRVARRFHDGLVAGVLAVAEEVGVERLVLSGGCFQNRVLTLRLVRALRQRGFEVLLHGRVPPNDGGIALGQVLVAAAVLRGRTPAGN